MGLTEGRETTYMVIQVKGLFGATADFTVNSTQTVD